MGAQDGHLDLHTAPELCENRPGPFCFTSTEARWIIRDGDGEGGRGRKSEGSIPPEKDRRDRGPPPEQ